MNDAVAPRPLEGQVAWITGASRGIGRSIAQALAAQGADLAISGRSLDSLEPVRADLAAAHPGQKITPIPCDVASVESVTEAVAALTEAHDHLDILVNNAGITRDGLLLRMKEEDWDEVLSTNLKGTFNTCRQVARILMKRRRGRIINITSVVGLVGNVGQANYSASKGGVIALTYTLAKEFASRGVLVNAVAPGFIETDMTAAMPQEARDQINANIPLGRIGSSEDVASLVAFLAGPGASYITGEVIRVDGGMAIG